MCFFIDMVRSKHDPPRRQRGREAGDIAPHLTLKKTTREEWATHILAHLGDYTTRTLNRIAVEMVDKTADVVSGSPFHEGLWLLVERGQVEYTMRAPVLFRKIRHVVKRKPAVPDGPECAMCGKPATGTIAGAVPICGQECTDEYVYRSGK